MLPPTQQQELRALTKALDPFRLFQQVERLQQATLRCEADRISVSQPAPTSPLVRFELAGCAMELVLQGAREPAELPQVEQESMAVLNWRRTSKDPFAGQWKQILTWVRANPTRSSGDILRADLLRRLSGTVDQESIHVHAHCVGFSEEPEHVIVHFADGYK